MTIALTLSPAKTINETNCDLVYIDPQEINHPKLLKQHHAYCDVLVDMGFQVYTLPDSERLPDSVCIEDPVVVLDEIAILTRPKSDARKGEVDNIEPEIAKYRSLHRILEPATLEGGDVLRIGKILYVGLSTQTNREGIEVFKKFVEPLGYSVVMVEVIGALHLKTAVTALDSSTLLINSSWIDPKPFEKYHLIDLPKEEPFAANLIARGKLVMMHAGFPLTRDLVSKKGFTVKPVDISEFLKAEAGLTCLSVIFNQR